jgi:hypothetical protein
VNLSNALLQIASMTCCSLPHAESHPQVPLFDPDRSIKQTAIRRLGISESQKNLSDGVIR